MKKAGITGIIAMISILGGCCISIGCWGGANEKFERTEDLSREFSQAAAFQTETTNGSITVRGEETERIRVHAVITGRADTQEEARRLAEETQFQWQETDNTLSLIIQKPVHPKNYSVSVSLDITMPGQTSLNLKSTNGMISVSDIGKDVVAKTTNGRVELRNIDGSAEAGSTNGSITAEQIGGDVTGHTTNGKISCSGLVGNLDATTTNGSVGINYDSSAPADRNIHVRTTNGSVNITLPPDFAGTAQASTSNGKLVCDRPVTISGRIDKHLSGTIGQGSGRLVLKTTNGSIHIQ